MSAGKTPRARRLNEDDPRELDDIAVVIPVDVSDGRLHIPKLDALLTVSKMSIQEGDAKDDLVDHADLDVEGLAMMPSKMMKELMCHCGGVVMSSMASRPLGSLGLCYHVKR